jgi:hypothetical protein
LIEQAKSILSGFNKQRLPSGDPQRERVGIGHPIAGADFETRMRDGGKVGYKISEDAVLAVLRSHVETVTV